MPKNWSRISFTNAVLRRWVVIPVDVWAALVVNNNHKWAVNSVTVDPTTPVASTNLQGLLVYFAHGSGVRG